MILLRQIPSLLKNISLINRNILKTTNQSWTNFHQTVTRNAKVKNLREEKYKRIDQISENYTLIYKAPMENYLMFCKNFTMFSFVAIGSVALYKYWNDIKFVDMDYQMTYNNLSTSDQEIIGFIVGFFIFNIVIRVMLNKYPLRIYKKNSDYTAVFQGQMPFSKKYTNFSSGEVAELPPKGILPWRDSRYRIKKTNVIMLSAYFKTPAELNSMMKHCK